MPATNDKTSKGLKTKEFFEAVEREFLGDGPSISDIQMVFEATGKVLLEQLQSSGELKIPHIGKAVLKVRKAGEYPVPFGKPGVTKMLPEKKKVRFRVTKEIRNGVES